MYQKNTWTISTYLHELQDNFYNLTGNNSNYRIINTLLQRGILQYKSVSKTMIKNYQPIDIFCET